MDRDSLYRILDIESPEEFLYYENLASLLEEDDFIENDLIRELLEEIDIETLSEHMSSYFEGFLSHIPDNESDLYITVENMKRAFDGLIFEGMGDAELSELSNEISRFRKWYVHDLNAFNRLNGEESSVRDARFDIAAAKLLGEDSDYDFSSALDYELDGFNVMIADMIAGSESDKQAD